MIILNEVYSFDVIRRVPEQILLKLESSANHVFDIGWSQLLWWKFVGQLLDVLGVALPDSVLINVSGSNHPFGGMLVSSGSLQDIFHCRFPAQSDLEHE